MARRTGEDHREAIRARMAYGLQRRAGAFHPGSSRIPSSLGRRAPPGAALLLPAAACPLPAPIRAGTMRFAGPAHLWPDRGMARARAAGAGLVRGRKRLEHARDRRKTAALPVSLDGEAIRRASPARDPEVPAATLAAAHPSRTARIRSAARGGTRVSRATFLCDQRGTARRGRES